VLLLEMLVVRKCLLISGVYVHQNAYDRKIVERMMLCRDATAGYTRYICPGCGYDRRVPFT
jgi:hypothetical protein